MGICNIDDDKEIFESVVDVDSIGRVLDMDKEDICSQLESIIKRSEDNTSIYEWYTYVIDDENKKEVKQIITDAEYHDGVAIFRYNYSLKDTIVRLKTYYMGHIEEIVKKFYS